MYSVIGFGLASFLLIAVYMFLNGQQHSQLPRCWLFEPDDDGTCDKVIRAPLMFLARHGTLSWFHSQPFIINNPQGSLGYHIARASVMV